MPTVIDFHPIANVFPIMTESELIELGADILDGGLRVPIVLYCGRILDGRNRYIACLKIGYEPTFTEYTGNAPIQFSLSLNLQRRHLTPSQKAAAGASLANLRVGRFHGNQYCPAPSGADHDAPISQTIAAEMVGSSRRAVQRAVAVQKADPKLHQEVLAGKVTLENASRHVAQEMFRQVKEEFPDIPSEKLAKLWNAAPYKKTSDKPDRAEPVVRVDHHPEWPRGPGTIRGETEELCEELVKQQVKKWGVPEVEINAYIRSWTMSVLSEEPYN